MANGADDVEVIRRKSAEAGGDGQDVDTKAALRQAFATCRRCPKVGGDRMFRERRRSRPAALATVRRMDYNSCMNTAPPSADRAEALRPETEAERRDRLAWEAEGIAVARADVAAGRVVEAAEIDAWIDSFDGEHELPIPYSGR